MPTLPGYAWLGSDAETFVNETVYPTPTVSQLLETTTPQTVVSNSWKQYRFTVWGRLDRTRHERTLARITASVFIVPKGVVPPEPDPPPLGSPGFCSRPRTDSATVGSAGRLRPG